jgi:hypothetical protein
MKSLSKRWSLLAEFERTKKIGPKNAFWQYGVTSTKFGRSLSDIERTFQNHPSTMKSLQKFSSDDVNRGASFGRI